MTKKIFEHLTVFDFEHVKINKIEYMENRKAK